MDFVMPAVGGNQKVKKDEQKAMKKDELIALFSKKPLFTNRTVLRPMSEIDLNDFLTHAACSMSVAGTELEGTFREKCKEQILSETEISFSIHLKEDDKYIGYFELKGLDSAPEIGIDLIEDYQKQGIGFEVCRAAIDYIFDNTDITTLKYNCFRSNLASLKLADRLGAIKITEKVLFEKLKGAELSQEIIDESAAFDLIVHEIRKQN